MYINDMLKVVEAIRQGVKVGEGKVSGLLFAMTSWGRLILRRDCRSRLAKRWSLLGSGDSQGIPRSVP